ncbi:hypothetical protein TNCV_2927981 [Trichonephila clavipes]|nr:hypothetical protein TNCV_2927981 [Trichonephila clavipes]
METAGTVVMGRKCSSDITLEWEQLAKDVQLVEDIKIPRVLFGDAIHTTNFLYLASVMLPKKLMQLQLLLLLCFRCRKSRRSTNNSHQIGLPAGRACLICLD